MKKIILILFIGLHTFIYAQNTISGTINNKNNQPISNVEIHFSQIHKGTVTDIDGKYTISNLPNGKFNLVITSLGFETIAKEITINKNDTLNFTLKETAFTIDEVIISTPFNKLQSQNVMKVEHHSIKELKEMGSNTLIDAITNIPGISQISTGTSIGKPVIRGLSGNRVLVYAQGVRLENQQFGDEHGLGINEAGIGSIEVIKGPASLLYGSDALGGVLYFNPEKFANSNQTKVQFQEKYFSNTEGFNTSLMAKTSKDEWQFLVRGTYDTHLDYKVPSDSKVTNTRYIEKDFKTGIGFNHNKISSVLRYNYNNLILGINEDGITTQSTSRNPDFPRQKVYNHILSLHNHFFFENSKLDADFGYLYNDRSEFEDSSIPSMQIILKTFNYDIKYHLPKIGKLESIVGIQGMHQTNGNKAEEQLIPDATIDDFGLFTTANYEWKNNVVQAGIRFDSRKLDSQSFGIPTDIDFRAALNKTYTNFNTSLGYKTVPFDKTILRLNLASGFRAPNLAELTSNGVHEGTNRYEIGNENLDNEQNFQVDVAFAYKNEHFDFFTNGFYNAVDSYIFLQPTNQLIDNNLVFKYIQNNAELYGGEFGFHFHPHPFDWLHISSSFESVIGKINNGSDLPLIPANKINTTVKAGLGFLKFLENPFVTINLTNTLKQHKISQFETISKGYDLVNLGFGGKFNWNKIPIDISLNANNLFDKKYISHLSRLKVDDIPNPGRNISVGFSVEF